MRKLLFLLIAWVLVSCFGCSNSSSQKIDLTVQWDTIRPLANPDKGWYHHMLDNGIEKYLIQDENDLTNFPGMDHLYLRLAWAYLEPEEGKFDWSYIDNIVEKYVPMGYKISFRISCKETGPAPGSVPLEINGIRYATPYWVIKAGAKGTENQLLGKESWGPKYDDPIFIEKLDHFHKAFAERYDGKSFVRYIDVGSIGEWGEGHTHRSTRIPPSVELVKNHIDLYLKHYKHSQILVSDDLLAYEKSEDEQKELLDYVIENKISLRDDSPMVKSLVENILNKWTVKRPHFFDAAYKTMPTVFELQHYGHVKEDGNWLGKNGEEIIPNIGINGADIFRNAVRMIKPTYIGFHGYLDEWLKDNPDLTNELLNLCGYWYFPKSINTTLYENGKLLFEMDWLNKGVAPAYSTYQIRGKLIPVENSSESIDFSIEDSGNRNWMPEQVSTEKYELVLSGKPKGDYWLAIQLFDKQSNKPVEIGLKTELKNGEYFSIQKLTF